CTDRLDHTRTLVPEDRRQRHGQVAVDHVQVAVADAARPQAHEHLVGAWCAQGQQLDTDRLADGVHDGGAHGLHRLTSACAFYGGRRRGGKGRGAVASGPPPPPPPPPPPRVPPCGRPRSPSPPPAPRPAPAPPGTRP